jgi:hypothetical protein
LTNIPSSGLTGEIVQFARGSESHQLWFRGENRSAELHLDRSATEAVFHWDRNEMFRFRTDDHRELSAVLKRWVGDQALPSAMRKEFPTLEIGQRADYYESCNREEGDFIHSWDQVETFYGQFPKWTSVLSFLSELRRGGYDRKLRAGTSMGTFIVSRSRRLGLRAEQPSVGFCFNAEGSLMDVAAKNYEGVSASGIPIALSNQVNDALERLANQPID